MKHQTIRNFTGIAAGIDSTDASNNSLSYAKNVILRPAGAISRLPPLKKVWGFAEIQNYKIQLGITDSDGAVLCKIRQPNPNSETQNEILFVHDFKNNVPLGLFFLQADARKEETSLDDLAQFIPVSPPESISVLKKGLAEKERWFFYSFFDSVLLGNGVDLNLIYQRNRTGNPLRVLGTDEVPDVPVILSASNTVNRSDAKTSFKFATARFGAVTRILAETKWDAITQKHFMILRWTPTDSASGYTIDFSYDNDYAVKTTVFIQSETAWQFTGLEPSRRLYYRIRAQYTTNGELFYSGSTGGSHTTPAYGFAGASQGIPTQIPSAGVVSVESELGLLAVGTFRYAQGNNIKVSFAAAGGSLSSSRTGEGTSSDSIEYIVSGIGSASLNQLRIYINTDPLVSNILNAGIISGSGESYGLTSKPAQQLTGGVGTPEEILQGPLLANSEIALTYFDPGFNSQGLESALSVPLKISTGGIKLIRPVFKSDANLLRFSKIKVYYRINSQGYIGDLPAGKWVLLGECPNEPNTSFTAFTKPYSSETVLLPDSGGAKIDRLPPCNVFEICADRLFAAGNKNNTKRIWYSNLATKDVILPEAFNITKQLVDMPSSKNDGTPSRVTFLQALDQTLQIHTDKGIVMMDGFTFNRRDSRSDFGALNPAAASMWKNQSSPYVGSDGVLYEMQNQQVLKSLIANETSWDYIKTFVDTEELIINPNKVNVYGDFTNQLVWVWMPCIFNNQKKLGGFIYDYRTKGITGPITGQGLVSSTTIHNTDSRIIGQTESGQLVYLDSRDLNLDNFRDDFAYTGQFFATDNSLSFTTNFLDCGSATTNKVFGEIIFSLVRGSQVQSLAISMETDDGKVVSINYGSVVKEINKIAFLLAGYNVKISFNAETIPNKPFVVRNLTIGYEELKTL